ncbi:hypothetical protein SEA_PAVLO_114 [Microbacterium phage Pavlo]|nr:hypothetical protein SEA_PAVLO_2 [Microbacterium phage Pavlo]UVG34170.1 hypothetical protein SEA_PAVLO_114 [Microbacterium phage Pavlo]
MAVTHNTIEGAPGIPMIIESPDTFPFAPGERDSEWHDTTDAEYAVYAAYWDSQDGAFDPAPEGWEDYELVNAAQHAANPNRLDGEL